ncbi:hypothetical protein [Microbacterium sp. NPDC091662]|uniref:hypothetical protein n=1 Tax=Microbacterium sp. NPDC091662 TaxID=3364211 RepID=UPI003816A7C1
MREEAARKARDAVQRRPETMMTALTPGSGSVMRLSVRCVLMLRTTKLPTGSARNPVERFT